ARVPGGADPRPGAAVRVMVRPEELRIWRDGAERGARGGHELAGRVLDRRFAGAATFYRVAVDDAELLVQGEGGEAEAGEAVYLGPRDGARAVAFPAEAR
ncbi:MAG TPA: TOBE domain-containing protein, partial [Longimicrobiaceae bacterium]|nr:TOBE domain-containing protein [Longimicrobiaceae bacterium]